MAFKVLFAAEAERDFELIFDFLVESHLGFGDTADSAIERAENRIRSIQEDIESLSHSPYRGTLHDGLMPGLRHVTFGRAIVWFEIIEKFEEARILAVFFGGQDHHRRMLMRLLG